MHLNNIHIIIPVLNSNPTNQGTLLYMQNLIQKFIKGIYMQATGDNYNQFTSERNAVRCWNASDMLCCIDSSQRFVIILMNWSLVYLQHNQSALWMLPLVLVVLLLLLRHPLQSPPTHQHNNYYYSITTKNNHVIPNLIYCLP